MKFERAIQFFALLETLGSSEARPPQVLGRHTSTVPTAGRRRLNGKFLHITDIHPDPYYKVYSSTDDAHACHRGQGPAGYYGAETSDCDTPVSLVNATFDWIEKNLKDEIDFIVWTGDSAKHDNDERIPRTQEQVVEQNQLIAEKFMEVFGTYKGELSIPIVPTLGNNDVLPHNIFKEGPNKWTKTYLDIWEKFIPKKQRKQFKKGGWFMTEVIPDKLAVISLNTLYFFDSNSAVNGCVAKSEPGYEHFEWLRKQLEHLRARGMKVMIMGHVPPARVDSRADWVESCWQKYTLWQQKYRDVIVGSFYGHMNIDHFMLQDFKNIKKSVKKGYATLEASEASREVGEVDIMSAKDYLNDLREYFAKIPSFGINDDMNEIEMYDEEDPSWFEDLLGMVLEGKKKHGKKQDPLRKIGGKYGERYSLAFVAPSVVPNYFPTLRVFEYNTTGLPEYVMDPDASELFEQSPKPMPRLSDLYDDFEDEFENLQHKVEEEVLRKKKHHFKVPKAPSKSMPPGPAYSPQTLSLTGYTQYFANLTHINNDFANAMSESEEDEVDEQRWKEGKHKGKTKKGKPHPRKFEFHVEYDTFKDKKYGLKDLTVRSYIELARLIGDTKKRESNDSWHTFIHRAFVGTIDPEDLEHDFRGWNTTSIEEAEGGAASLEL